MRKQATTDENPVYGIYDDGSCYNVVTDENTYYASQIIINCLNFISYEPISKVLNIDQQIPFVNVENQNSIAPA